MVTKQRLCGVPILLIVALGSFGTAGEAVADDRDGTPFRRMPVVYIENRGQLDARVRYYQTAKNATLYFTPGGVTIAQTDGAQRWAVKMDFLGANPVTPIGRRLTEAIISYFKGPEKDWKAGLPTYSEVVYPNLWPGIDLVYSGEDGHTKYSFLVAADADPRRIRIGYRGATEVGVNGVGELTVIIPTGGFGEEQPYAYQNIAGQRRNIATAFQVRPDELSGTHVLAFAVDNYDRSQPLTIDPTITIYGGDVDETGEGHGVAFDERGSAYLAGFTVTGWSSFPIDPGFDLSFND